MRSPRAVALEAGRRSLAEQSLRSGQVVAVMVLGDVALLLAQVVRVRRPSSEPVVDVFGVAVELPCLPSVLIGPAEYVDAWHETAAGPRLRVRVAATAYVLAPYRRRD